MGLSVKIGTFSSGTGNAGTTIAISGVGFQPKAILFWWIGRSETVDTLGRATYRRGFGCTTGTTSRWAVSSSSVNAAASIDGGRYQRQDECVIVPNTSGSAGTAGQLDLSSLDADGFTLVVDQKFTTDLRVMYLALGGTDITSAGTGSFTAPASTGSFDVTNVGFQPDSILMTGCSLTTTPGGSLNRSHFGIGAASGASNQWAWAGGAGPEGNATSQSRSYLYSGECLAMLHDTVTSAMMVRASFTSFLSNGFRLNATATYSGLTFFYLAIAGAQVAVGDFLTRTDGNDIAVSGLGFAPSAVLLLSHMQAESTAGTVQTQDGVSIGAFTGTNERGAMAEIDVDAQADMTISTSVQYAAVYHSISTSGTTAGLMDVKSMDSGGFTCVMDDADPAQAVVGYLAFGQAYTPQAYTLACLAGSVAQTGQAANLRNGHHLDAAQGVFNQAGQVTACRAARKMPAAGGTITATGQAGSLKAARKLALAAGSDAVSGQGAGLSAARKMPAAVGAAVLTGQATGVRPARKLAATAGALSQAGQAAGLRRGYPLALTAGTFALSGMASSPRMGRKVGLVLGTMAVAGQAVTARGARKLTAMQGGLMISGIGVTLVYTPMGRYILAVGTGLLTMTGQPAGVHSVLRLAAGQGSFVLSGQTAGLRTAHKLAGAAGLHLVSGAAVGLLFGRALRLATGDYALDGQPAALRAARWLLGSQGSFALSGLAIGMLLKRVMTLPAERTAWIAAEARVLAIEAEGRTRLIPADQRTCEITGETRIRAVPHEDRTYRI